MQTHKRRFVESIKKLSQSDASSVMHELLSLLGTFAKKNPELSKLLDEIAELVLKEMRLL